jgi:hypothetical protein
MIVLLYIPGAFLFSKIFLRIGRTSSVRSRTFFPVLVCTEMPAETAFPFPVYPRTKGQALPGDTAA